jgi:hypothetical protein
MKTLAVIVGAALASWAPIVLIGVWLYLVLK